MYKLIVITVFGLLLVSNPAMAACTGLTSFTPGTTADASAVNNNFNILAACTTVAVPTRQVLTSGSSATYTTPANVRQLRVRMVGAGGGGAGVNISAFGNNGASAGTTTFASVNANGGAGGGPYSPSLGGNGGTGTASIRIAGGQGSGGGIYAGTNPVQTQITGLAGGNSMFGGAGGAGVNTSGGNAAANSGSGGGGSIYCDTAGGGHQTVWNGSGAAGEYVELVINSPSATYTYTVGAGGTGGTGTQQNGGNGAAGIIIVDEYY